MPCVPVSTPDASGWPRTSSTLTTPGPSHRCARTSSRPCAGSSTSTARPCGGRPRGSRPTIDDVDWDADADWDWHSAAHDSPETLHTLFDEAVAASDRDLEAALATGGLDQLSVHESRRYGGGFS